MQLLPLYFVITAFLSVLTGIACLHSVVGALLFVLPPLGLLLMAAPTALLYWLALTPLALAFRAQRLHITAFAAATLIPVALAIGPGLLSKPEAKALVAHASAQDINRPMPSRPRSIELAGDVSSGIWTHMHSVGDKAAWCNDICTRLLMNGEVDWIRMTTMPGLGGPRVAQSVIYRVEHRGVCPNLPVDYAGAVGTTLRDRLLAGDCLISEPDNHLTPDAVVRLTTNAAEATGAQAPDHESSWHATIESVKRLRIESHQEMALQQTETVTRPLALPFYLGVSPDFQCGSKCNGVSLGRNTIITRPIELAQALRQTLGYEIAEIPAANAEAPRQVSESILSLPAGNVSTFSAQQQDVLNETLRNIQNKGRPSDADMDFIRRIIADDRITNPLIAVTIQNISARNSASLEPLIPTILDRITIPVNQRDGNYKNVLGWSLQNVPAEQLRPYSDKMLRIVAGQPDWTTFGVLTRLAELRDDNAVNLVIDSLGTKEVLSSRRQFAAIAACRADTDAWPRLEPAVLARLTLGRQHRIDEDDAALLLALVRFGEKPRAIDIVQKRGLTNETNVIRQMNGLETNFDPRHCRDRL